MSNIITITTLDKPALLAAVYNRSHSVNASIMAEGYDVNHVMTRDEAMDIMTGLQKDRQGKSPHMIHYFDYYRGRYMKVNLTGDMVDPYMFDKEYGFGALQHIVDQVRGD